MQLTTYNTLIRHMRGATPAVNLVVESERIITNILPCLSSKFGLSAAPSLEAVNKRQIPEGRPVILLQVDATGKVMTIGDTASNAGNIRAKTVSDFCNAADSPVSAVEGLRALCEKLITDAADAYVVLVMLDQQITPVMKRLLLRHCISEVPATIVLVTSEPLDDVTLRSYIPVVSAERPSVDELATAFGSIMKRDAALFKHTFTVTKLDDSVTEDLEECANLLARSLAGLDLPMALVLLRLHISAKLEEVKDGKIALDASELANEKAAVLNKEGYVELITDLPDEGRIGGLNVLKQWIKARRQGFTKHAQEQKLAVPKGVMLVGPPGTAKSLSAKVIAGMFGVPLIRLDVGALFNKMLGSSERNMRTALSIIDASSPCVAWLDEVSGTCSASC